jgi:hypothetical protein
MTALVAALCKDAPFYGDETLAISKGELATPHADTRTKAGRDAQPLGKARTRRLRDFKRLIRSRWRRRALGQLVSVQHRVLSVEE